MTYESSTLEKGRSVLMAGLMVLSVIAMSTAFVGGAAAQTEENVTFNDQAIGENEDGEDVFVVESVDANAGQFLEIKNEDTGEVVFEQTIDSNLQNAALYTTGEEPSQYSATVYEDESRANVKATDTAMVYDASISVSNQTSSEDTIEQVTIDTVSLWDGDDDDTEFDIVLSDVNGQELGRTTGLTGTNEDVTVDTSAIETDTQIIAMIEVDGELLQTYNSEVNGFVPVADSATVTPGVEDADESVTFRDQAIGQNEDGEDIFVVESVDANAGQFLEIKNEDTDEILFEQTIQEPLQNAALYTTVEEPGQYSATVYEDDSRDDVKATDTAMVYDASIEMSDQTSAKGTLEQITVDVASLLDGDDDDTEFDVVLTDEDGTELGSATELTGANEDVTIDTSTIDTQTEVTATIYVDGEPLQAYDSDVGAFATVSDSATVNPDVKNKHDKKKGDDKKDAGDDDKKDAGDDDKKDAGDDEKDTGDDDTDDSTSNDADGDQDTSSETDQDQNSNQDNDQIAENDQEQKADQENTDEGLPGFGVGVAMIALLAAAMLALRRQD